MSTAAPLVTYANARAAAKRMAWLLTARDAQLPPPDFNWRGWWLRSGRGTGKTRVGAEWIVEQARTYPNTRWHVVAATQSDLRVTCFEGESGLLSVLDPSELKGGSVDKGYNKTEHRITLANGSMILGFSAEKPSRLRGPQCHGGWLDEISSWAHPITCLDMFEFGLRLPLPMGGQTRFVITSTPKKNEITRNLAKDPAIHVTTENTYDNIENLDPAFAARLISKYEGTRVGKQEIYGIVLDDVEGAMWKSDWFRTIRGNEDGTFPELDYIATRVGWDPAVTSTDKSDLHGIVGMGRLAANQYDDPWQAVADLRDGIFRRSGDLVTIADRSDNMTPVQAARAAISLAVEIGAPEVIIEDNQGKDTWKSVWKEAGGPASGIRLRQESAGKSKEMRAVPLAMLYEQSFNLGVAAPTHIWHMPGLEFLEDEQVTWVPAESPKSPNRIDALVWAAYGLGVRASSSGSVQRAGRLSEVV